jgi:hypothetical protein
MTGIEVAAAVAGIGTAAAGIGTAAVGGKGETTASGRRAFQNGSVPLRSLYQIFVTGGAAMSDARELNKAIAVHGTWKVRLHDAIESGSSEFKPENVRLDNACDFGKWLYAIPIPERPKDFWGDVQKIHARFHTAAAVVLRLALDGKKQEALDLMTDMRGEFVSASKDLTNTLFAWKSVSS